MMLLMVVDELSDAERRVWLAFPTGQLVDFGTANGETDDPAHSDSSGSGRQVRAEVVASLLCGAIPVKPGHIGKVALRAARVTGLIDLREAVIEHSLSLDKCDVRGGIDLTEAVTRSVRLVACCVGPVRMSRAYVKGQLDASGAQLNGNGGPALDADGLTVTGDVLCGQGFHADGEIRLRGASIGGQLSFRSAHLDGRGQPALDAERLAVTGDTLGDEGFRADGEIRLLLANIGGQLILSGAQLNGRNRPALDADGLAIASDIFCDEGFNADGETHLPGASIRGELILSGARFGGEVRLVGASIGGRLILSGAQLDGRGRPALNADQLNITGSMLCDEAFRANGETRLTGATIGGQLNFSGARLDGGNGPALTADGLTVTAGMYCERGFHSKGQIGLRDARIGGPLSFSSAQLRANDQPALKADRLAATAGMFCHNGFQADGEIRLRSARIDGPLSFRDAELRSMDGPAINSNRLTVTGDFLCDGKFHVDGEIDLGFANVGTLIDDWRSWPCRLNIDGFTYGGLSPYLPARERLRWLRHTGDYCAQPYEQLAAYYRRLGHDEQARRVLLAKQRARRKQRSMWLRWPGWAQDGLAGYGYAPSRAIGILLVAFIAGWMHFRAHHPPPVRAGEHPSFNAALYTLDLLIPTPGLGHSADWNPHGAALALAAGLRALGWLLAITVIAAITRVLSRS
jgi:hypothetical protein